MLVQVRAALKEQEKSVRDKRIESGVGRREFMLG